MLSDLYSDSDESGTESEELSDDYDDDDYEDGDYTSEGSRGDEDASSTYSESGHDGDRNQRNSKVISSSC